MATIKTEKKIPGNPKLAAGLAAGAILAGIVGFWWTSGLLLVSGVAALMDKSFAGSVKITKN